MVYQDQQEIQDMTFSLTGSSDGLEAWFRFYDELLSRRRYRTSPPGTSQAIHHSKVVEISKYLKVNSGKTREKIVQGLMGSQNIGYNKEDLENALDITVQAIFMTDPVTTRGLATSHVYGDPRPNLWASKETFFKFMNESFPQIGDLSTIAIMMEDQDSLKAWKLANKLKVIFKGTNNLADHLLYDRGTNTVYLFHHVAFLNAHLSGLANSLDFDSRMDTCLQAGTLPPRLLFETLHSLQWILFPSTDRKAHKMMGQLVQRSGFDPEFKIFSGYQHKDAENEVDDLVYKYWGPRLVVLHDLLRDRPPVTKWEKWLQWQSSDANAFAVAILALIISILVGIISLGLGAMQVWIAWMAWKHPVG